jgi:hypothetical protein
MSKTASRAKRLAAAAAGEKVVKSYRIPEHAPTALAVASLLLAIMLCASWVSDEIRERQQDKMILADIRQMCMQPVAIEDYADCYGRDCRLVYALAVSNQQWRDALVTQEEILQRSCRIIRHRELMNGSSPLVTTMQANLS